MCGIAGIFSSKRSISNNNIKAACNAIAHRGPESEQFYFNADRTAWLGHRRLSIIDLTNTAAQPMKYCDRYYIIHNGELYNYIELRNQLQKRDYKFTTNSDTEVIVAAYAAFGTDCLQHFDGMFSFAIWDQKEQVLFAARDRFGEKPFFYFYDGEQFVFASEMKGLWAAGVAKEVNTAMVYNFLTIGYTANPADPHETFYKNISKLPSASYLTFSLITHELSIDKYWHLDVLENETIHDEIAVEQFQTLLSESVQKRLRSDVAIGTSLSGGLDSSAIVALCSRYEATQYSHKCFTASFSGFDKNEVDYARCVAENNGLQHHTVEVNANDVLELMNTVMHHQELPVASASAIAQYKVYKAAKENGVTVLLDGQGADEVLAGYHKFYKWHWQQLYRKNDLHRSGELSKAKRLRVNESFGLKNKVAAVMPEFAAAMLQTIKTRKAHRHADFDRDFAFINKQNLYYATPTSFDLNGALYFDAIVYGLEDLLRIADRNSMASAVEIRLPFLNQKLVEYLFTLPAHFKIRNGWTKWLLRKTVEKTLPDKITWRRDKVGFEPPQKVWMSDKRIQDAVQEGKKKLVQQKILKPSVLNKKIQPQDANAADSFDWRYWSASYLF